MRDNDIVVTLLALAGIGGLLWFLSNRDVVAAGTLYNAQHNLSGSGAPLPIPSTSDFNELLAPLPLQLYDVNQLAFSPQDQGD
jgi:hypothetical protein